MKEQGWWLTLHPPERVSDLVLALRGIGLFSVDRTWWFAWNTLDIVLPSLLVEDAPLDRGWEVVRVFAKRAELRIGRRGMSRGCWLFLEENPQAVLGDLYKEWVEEINGDFVVEDGYRLLAGQKLRLPEGDRRGEIIYPRPLDYGIGKDNLEQSLVASVWVYYDKAHRLVTVRYAGIKLVKPGSIPVQPFPEPEEAMRWALSS